MKCVDKNKILSLKYNYLLYDVNENKTNNY